jgi:hypothetical protein
MCACGWPAVAASATVTAPPPQSRSHHFAGARYALGFRRRRAVDADERLRLRAVATKMGEPPRSGRKATFDGFSK